MHYDGFPFPITLSASGPLFSWLMAVILVLSGHTKLERRITFRIWLRNIFPVGFFTAVTYATGKRAVHLPFRVLHPDDEVPLLDRRVVPCSWRSDWTF